MESRCGVSFDVVDYILDNCIDIDDEAAFEEKARKIWEGYSEKLKQQPCSKIKSTCRGKTSGLACRMSGTLCMYPCTKLRSMCDDLKRNLPKPPEQPEPLNLPEPEACLNPSFR